MTGMTIEEELSITCEQRDALDIECARLEKEVDALRQNLQGTRDMSEWHPIKTAPKDLEALFWIVPKTANDRCYCTTSGKPILLRQDTPGQVRVCKLGGWSSLVKATHWTPLPAPPST